ncbi:hypothetical protein K7459_25175 [Pseudomonas fluorescens]|nr:hypothetical protein [Pseudomonas fluorescens]MBY9041195.1 hypothetical protein [Pseudomonas fluorescens]MBY9050480.1 hypothetical protein [Pseudomonas fluorescens]
MGVLGKFSPNEQRQFCAIGRWQRILGVGKRFEQAIAGVFPEQVFDPGIDRYEMEMEWQTRLMTETADIKTLGLQKMLNDLPGSCEQPSKLRQCLSRQLVPLQLFSQVRLLRAQFAVGRDCNF